MALIAALIYLSTDTVVVAMLGTVLVLFALAQGTAIFSMIKHRPLGYFVSGMSIAFSGSLLGNSPDGLGTLDFMVALAIALPVSFAVALILSGFVTRILEYELEGEALLFALSSLFLGIIALQSLVAWEATTEEQRSLFLFLAVLPLTNALFDALSYGVTLVLTQLGLRGRAFLCAITDVAAALLLFLLLGAALVVIVAGMHQGAGVAFVDLGGLLAQAGDWRTYWWLYAMLFSTAVPTLIHLAIASFSLQALMPLSARNWICKEIREARDGDTVSGLIATLSLGSLWFLSLALPLALLSGVIWAAWMYGLESAALFYRDWLLSVAIWMEGI
jgi:hypothetical protein